jgi:hypothetical protein
MFQTPLLFAFLDTAMLDDAALVIIVEWQGLVHRGEERGPEIKPFANIRILAVIFTLFTKPSSLW